MDKTTIAFEFSAIITNTNNLPYNRFYDVIINLLLKLKQVISPNETVFCTRTNTWEDDTLPFLVGWLDNPRTHKRTMVTFTACCVVHDNSVQDIMKFCKITQSYLFPYIKNFTVRKEDGDYTETVNITEPINEHCYYDIMMEDNGKCKIVNYGLRNIKYQNQIRKVDTYENSNEAKRLRTN